MRDPFQGYDAWLEAPIQRMYAEADAEVEAWQEFCAERNGYYADVDDDPNADADEMVMTIVGPRPVPRATPRVPVDAYNKDHPDHAIYIAWVNLENAIQERGDRLWAESEAEAEGDEAEANWEAYVQDN